MARPTKYKTILTKSRVNICVLCIWVISVFLNAPHLFEMKAATGPDNKPQCMWIVLTEGTTRMVVAIFEFLGKFFLPLLTASLTMVSLHRRVKTSPALFQSNRGKAGLRLLRMCMLTTLIRHSGKMSAHAPQICDSSENRLRMLHFNRQIHTCYHNIFFVE